MISRILHVDKGEEIKFGDRSFVQNGGLIRVDPSYNCVAVVLNMYTIVIIPLENDWLKKHYVIYKSTLGIHGQIKDLQFLQNCIFPTMAILEVCNLIKCVMKFT